MNEKLRILNLEDSPNDAELVRERLNEDGIDCEIHRVDNRADFITALDRGDIDLILADYTLPSFDGMSALAISLEKCPDTPLIFVSGTIDENIAIEALKSGATDYVIKSKLSRLAPAVRRALKEAKDRVIRKQAEEELRKLNRILQAKSRSSEAMMRSRDELGYLNEVCRIVVEDCGHALVWIGYAQNDEEKTVRRVAHAGLDEGYLESLKITWADVERGRGPVGTAIRTGKPSLSRNIIANPGFAPWRDEALKRGYASVIGVPLLKDGKAFGSLNIYSREQDPFFDDEVRLLSDLSADLSYGIDAIRLRTAQDEAETALRESERRFRLLFENMLEGFAYCKMLYENGVPQDFIYLDVNAAFEKLTGLKDVIGKKVTEVIPGVQESLPELFVIYGRVALTGIPERFETFLESFGGWLSISVYSTEKEYFVAVFDNITERKRAEEALRQSEAFLGSIVENIPAMLFVKDAATLRFVRFNRAAEELLGYSREEMLGRNDHDFFPASEADLYNKKDREVLQNNIPIEILEETVQTRHHGERIVHTKKIPLQDEKGKPKYLLGISEDITERKQAEQALHRREAEFRKLSQEFHGLLDAIPDSLMLLDRDLKVQWANKSVAFSAGKTPKEIKGQYCHGLWYGLSRPCDPCPVLQSLETGKPVNLIVTRQDGKVWDLRTIPLVNEQGEVVNVIELIREITEYRKIEEQLRHVQKMEAIGQLAGGVAHDFNNILNVIMGYGGLIMEDLAPGSSSREQMHEVLAAAERAAVLTKRLLLFSRKQVAEVKPVEVNGIISGIQKMLNRIIGEDIDLRVDLADRPLTVMADSSQIEQVLMNLATNARDAMLKGGHLMITTETTHMDDDYVAAYGYGKVGAYAVIVVADTGKGIEVETQKKIFEPFFTTKGIGEGTGLGLAITYEIVKKHNGYIRCYSEIGKGTVFKIYLPLIEDIGASDAKNDVPGAIQGGTETIFVAEDDPSLRKLARLVLESFGYNVIIAKDGEEAVTKYRENKDRVQLVILDLVMPKKSGKEAYEEIRAISPGVRAFFLSGYTMDMINRMEIEAGMEVIRKPFAPKELLKKVREVLDRGGR